QRPAPADRGRGVHARRARAQRTTEGSARAALPRRHDLPPLPPRRIHVGARARPHGSPLRPTWAADRPVQPSARRPRARDGAPRARGPRRQGVPARRHALGRPAAARRDRARPHPGARRAARRRARREPRPRELGRRHGAAARDLERPRPHRDLQPAPGRARDGLRRPDHRPAVRPRRARPRDEPAEPRGRLRDLHGRLGARGRRGLRGVGLTWTTVVPDETASGERPGLPVPRRPAPKFRVVAVWGVMLALLAGGVWSFVELEIGISALVTGFENAASFISRMFPLDFPPAAELVALTLETLAIVTVATALAVVLSLPVALFAASNTTRNRWTGGAARTFIVLMRAIPDLVLAIIFFRLFGLGAVPGILAMGLHSIGMIGKLYADAIE